MQPAMFGIKVGLLESRWLTYDSAEATFCNLCKTIVDHFNSDILTIIPNIQAIKSLFVYELLESHLLLYVLKLDFLILTF
jgi:hypothetical protein